MKKNVPDKLDREILNVLNEDSRVSLREVSIKLNISPGTAKNRVDHLVNKGVLKGYTIVLDPIKLGYTHTAVIMIQTHGEIDSVKNCVMRFPNIISAYQTTGEFDLVIIAKSRGTEDLAVFTSQLSKIIGVQRIITDIALDIMKESMPAQCLGI